MKNWSNRRKASLAIHGVIAAVLLVWSIDASITFWKAVYKDDLFSYGTVFIVDLMALVGMGLRISKIESPFQWLRHLLPFVSVLPLSNELYAQFAQLAAFNRVALTASVLCILVVLAVLVWRTIESLFVDPAVAAAEAFQEQLDKVGQTLEQLREANEKAARFAAEHITVQSAQKPRLLPPQLGERDIDADIIEWKDNEGLSFEEIGRVLGITRQSVTARYNKAKEKNR